MITLFTGMPGAGKTAALIALLMKELGDRPLFVHFDPAERTRPEQKLLHETLLLPHQAINANDWHNQLPDGAVLVVDEVQGCWRPRGPATKVPVAIQALETHRHAGVDIFLTTQAPRLMDANIRGLVGRHVHIRDTGFLGRWWYEWPETNEGVAWKTCPVKKRYKLPKKVFEVYQSAVVHNKSIRTIPPAAYIAGAALLAALVGVMLVTRVVSKGSEPGTESTVAPSVQASAIRTGHADQVTAAAQLVDERVDFMPRMFDRPWTAPAYDHLRQVQVMPTITGSICVNDKCTCYHGKGKLLDVGNDACAAWTKERPFDPYAAPATSVASDAPLAGTGPASTPAAPHGSAAGSPYQAVGAVVGGVTGAL